MTHERDPIDELVRLVMQKLPALDRTTALSVEVSLREVYGGLRIYVRPRPTRPTRIACTRTISEAAPVR